MKLQTQWDLSKLGKGINDPRFKKERVLVLEKVQAFAKKWGKDKSFLNDEKKLRKALDQYNDIAEIGNKESLYLFLALSLNGGNIELQAAAKKLDDFGNQLSEYIRFFMLELAQTEKKYQKIFIQSLELKPYHQLLKDLFASAQHNLSEKEEKILSLKSGVASGNWAAMLDEFLSQEEETIWLEKTISGKTKIIKEKVPFEKILSELSSPKKKIRESAEHAMNKVLVRLAPIAEKEMNSLLEDKKINDELRSFARPDTARHLAEGVSPEIVDTLRTVVAKNFSLAHDFYRLKAKLLKQDSFRYAERNLRYGKLHKKYSYQESVRIVEQAFSRIDTEFVNIFQGLVSSGAVDVFPKKGKTGGAFCASHGVLDPIYIMLNYTETARDVTTLAHETGHAIHASCARGELQLNYTPPMATAEVASTFCEDFVFEEMLAGVSDEERLVMMLDKLQDQINTIFRQIAAYNFEFELHHAFREAGYLSRDAIGKIFNTHMQSYLGKKVRFDSDSALGWIYWGHFRSPFYVYSYAMGLLCAKAMQSKLKKDPSFIKEIKEFYQTGSSLSPKEIFAKMGVDITKADFWQEGIDEIGELLKETKKLAKKLKRI